MWIITKTDQANRWVNQPGSKNAYTNKRDNARRFGSEEAAKRDCCGNETPVKY